MLLISEPPRPSRRRLVRALTAAVAAVVAVLASTSGSVAAPACTISWDGGAANDLWQSAANWAIPAGEAVERVPAAGDQVCLGATANSAAVEITSTTGAVSVAGIQRDGSGADEPLVLRPGGRLNLTDAAPANASNIDVLHQLGGDLGGSAVVNVEELLWRAGTQDTPDTVAGNGARSAGTGRTVIVAGGSLSIDDTSPTRDINVSNEVKYLYRALEVQSGATAELLGRNANGGAGYLYVTGRSGRLVNAGTFTIREDQDVKGTEFFSSESTPGVFNTGTLEKVDGGTSSIDTRMDNDGTLASEAGLLVLSGAPAHASNLGSGQSATHGGDFDVTDGAELRWQQGGTHSVAGDFDHVAGTGADAVLSFTGATVAVGGANTIPRTLVSAGRVDFNAAQTLTRLEQTGGTLGGTATVTVTDEMLWRAGTQDTPDTVGGDSSLSAGTGRTVIAPAASLSIDDTSPTRNVNVTNEVKYLYRALQIQSGATAELLGRNANGSAGYLYVTGRSGRIDNAGTFTIREDQDVKGTSTFGAQTTPGIFNTGTIDKPDAGVSYIDPRLDNDGTVETRSGLLALGGPPVHASNMTSGQSATHTGDFPITDGAELHWYSGGTHAVAGDFTHVAGASGASAATLAFTGAEVTVTGADSVPRTLLTGGRVTFNSAQSLTRLEQTGGTLGGTATVTVTDRFVWRSGTQDTPDTVAGNGALSAGTGRTVIAGTASLSIDDTSPTRNVGVNNDVKSLHRALEIQSGATGELLGRNNANSTGYLNITTRSGRLVNAGTFTIREDQDIRGNDTYGSEPVPGIVNTGTIEKVGAGVSYIDPRLDNDGSLETEAGLVALGGQPRHPATLGSGESATHTGDFPITDGAELHWYRGGAHTVSGDVTHVAGASGATPALFAVTGADVSLSGADDAPRTLVTGGRLNLNAAQTLEQLDLHEGALGGSGAVTVETMTHRGGIHDGSGSTTVTDALTVARYDAGNPAAYNYPKYLRRHLRVASTATALMRDTNASNGQGFLYLDQAASHLEVEGDLTLQDDQDLFGSAGRVTIASTGSLTKAGGTHESVVQPNVDLDGPVTVDAAQLRFQGGGVNTHAGVFSVDGGAALHFNGGTHTIASADGIRRTPGDTSPDPARGVFNGGTVAVNAPYALDATDVHNGDTSFNGTTSPGTVRVFGGRGNFNTAASPASITLFEGSLGGSGQVTTPTMTQRGGVHDGSGMTEVTDEFTVARYDAGNPAAYNYPKYLRRHVRIASGADAVMRDTNANNGQGFLYLDQSASHLDVRGTLTLQDDQDLFGSAGRITIAPTGSLTKNGGSHESVLQPSVDLDGPVSVGAAQLRIQGGGVDPHASTFDVAGGATLQFNGGAHTLTSADGVRRTPGDTGPGVARGVFNGGSVTMNAPYALDATDVHNGDTSFNDDTSPGALHVYGGRVNFNTAATAPSLTQYDGTVGGDDTLTTATFTWRGGVQDTPDTGTPSNLQPGTGRTVVTGALTVGHYSATDPAAYNYPKHLRRELVVGPGAQGVLRDKNANNGQGYLTFDNRSSLLTVQGTLRLEDDQDLSGSTGRGVVVAAGGTLTKATGTHESVIDGWLDVNGTLLSEGGTLRLERMSDYDGATKTLGGTGTYDVRGRLNLRNGDIRTIANTVVLDGAGSRIDIVDNATPNAGIAGLNRTAATGDLAIRNGRDLTAPASGTGPFTNDGTLRVGAGTTLTPTGGLVNNGTLRGRGTVAGDVTNNGTVAPGDSPGQLSVGGDYVQTATGTLAAEIDGAIAGTGHDRLAVAGDATLTGTLDVPGSLEPSVGDAFDIVTCGGTCTGAFATVTGDIIDAERYFQPVYEAARVRLMTTSRAYPAVSVADVTVTEGDSGTATAQIPVTLSFPTGRTTTVEYATADGSATQPADYTAASGTLTFAPGVTQRTIEVPVAGDQLDEGAADTVAVTLSNPLPDPLGADGTTIDDGAATLTITDDDTPPVLVFAGDTVEEANAAVAIPVRLSAPSDRQVTVAYATSDDTASAGSDYTAASGTLTFARGDTEETITVPVLDDATDEPTEQLGITLSSPANASIPVGTEEVALRIVDNDVAGPADPTPAIAAGDARVNEGDAGTTTARFVLGLTEATNHAVTVTVATDGGTATEGTDYDGIEQQVTFPAGERTRTVDVQVGGDTADEPDETFGLVLSAPVGGTLATDAAGEGTIADDDPAPPEPVVPSASIDDVLVNEGDAGQFSARFEVLLSQAATQPVEIDYATENGTAAAPGDFTARSGTVTLEPGERRAFVDVPVSGDTADEADESYTVRLSGPAGATLADTAGQGTIIDDDAPAQQEQPPVVVVQQQQPQQQQQPAPTVDSAKSLTTTALPTKGCVKIGAFRYRFFVPMKQIVSGKLITRRGRVQRVVVTLDGKRIAKITKRPFTVPINGSKLKVGKHLLVAKVMFRHPKTKNVFYKTYRFRFSACT